MKCRLALLGALAIAPLLAAAQPNFAGKTITIIAANHMYNVAKPDGLTIGTFNRNLPIAQLTGVQGVKFDITRFAWIGSAANETTILAIRADLPYKTFAELRKAKEPVVIGSTGP